MIFLFIIDDYMKKIKMLKKSIENEKKIFGQNIKFKNCNDNIFFLYKLIFMKAISEANSIYYKYNRNLLYLCGL